MRFSLIVILIAMAAPAVSGQQHSDLKWLDSEPATRIPSVAGQIPVLDFQALKPLLEQSSERVYVINFWATWCAPCVKELPYFERMATAYAERGVEITLVSLDFPSMWEKRLPAFIEKRSIRSPVVVLDDPDQNTWIPAVSEEWSGAIPATLIYAPGRREFFEKSFEESELKTIIESFLND